MSRIISLIIIIGFFVSTAFSQLPKKRLPQNINVPTYTHIFPSLSGDGNQIIYLTNYSNTEGFETKYSFRTGQETWEDPELLSQINRPGLDHIGSFCLSHDGNFVVFASRRTPSIGNYDIWISEKNGDSWSAPVNPGLPLNSAANEGNPSLSPDGKSIYFMRCETMNDKSKNGCSIYVSHRVSATRWSEPERLPPSINSVHETTPRILADNKTLVFASGRAGGMGKLDLYTSKLENENWSNPQPLSFINTAANDEFVSIPARGDIIYFTAPYRDQHQIFKAIVPEEFRPEKVLMLKGTVAVANNLKPSEDVIVQAYDTKTRQVYTTTRPRKLNSSFTLFLPEGAVYDVSVFPQKGGVTYYSTLIDLNDMLISRKEEIEIQLESLRPGTSIPLTTVRYENYTADLTSESDIEIKRIIGFLKRNPRSRIEIGAFIDSLYTDSIPSNDLTELIIDTTFVSVPLATLAHADTELESSSEVELSSLAIEDQLQNISDSLLVLGYHFVEKDEHRAHYQKLKFTYHNNRTQKQADALLQRLLELGVPRRMLTAVGYGESWQVDHAAEERNYWIELKMLSN